MMSKQSLLLNAAWLVVAGAAFLLGQQRAGSDRAGERVAEAPPSRTDRSSSAAASSGGTGDSGPAGAGNRESRETGSRPSAGSPNFELLAREALRDPNPVNRRMAFSRLLESVTAENALAVREQLLAFGAEGREWSDFNYLWGSLAGREAFDFAMNSEEEDLQAVLTGWASANPSEAVALLDDLPERVRGDRDRLAESIVAGLADTDRRQATDLVLRLAGEGNERSSNLIDIVARESLRADGPEAASLWSESLPEGRLRATAMGRVARDYASRDLAAAVEWVERSAGQDDAARAVESVADTWARRQPAEAVTWLETLPAGAGQSNGLRSVFGDWEDRDPVAAGERLLAMPQSPQRDTAVSGFSRGYAWQDPQTAIAWAESIVDPALRNETLTSAGQAYFRRDPESARAWLENSSLPAEVQEAVRNPPRRRR